MADINRVINGLLVKELDAANAMQAQLMAADVSPDMIPALMYRCGILDERSIQKQHRTENREKRRLMDEQKKLEEATTNE